MHLFVYNFFSKNLLRIQRPSIQEEKKFCPEILHDAGEGIIKFIGEQYNKDKPLKSNFSFRGISFKAAAAIQFYGDIIATGNSDLFKSLNPFYSNPFDQGITRKVDTLTHHGNKPIRTILSLKDFKSFQEFYDPKGAEDFKNSEYSKYIIRNLLDLQVDYDKRMQALQKDPLDEPDIHGSQNVLNMVSFFQRSNPKVQKAFVINVPPYNYHSREFNNGEWKVKEGFNEVIKTIRTISDNTGKKREIRI